MSRLAGKVAVVSGGSQGIGRAICLAFAEEGATVVVNYSRSQGPADAVVSEIGADRAMAYKADAGSVPAMKQLVADVVAKYGKIDILVANAAKIGTTALADTTEEAFDEAFGVNVKGVYFLVKEAAPHIPDGGRIILISTSLTVNSATLPVHLLYNATKGAIEQMTRVLAKDLGRRNVTVNSVCPGPTATGGFYEGKTDALVDMIKRQALANRLAEPEEIANVALFVASPEASWVNGQHIRVNGGQTVG